MIVLNFSHPLSALQLEQLEAISGELIDEVIVVDSFVDQTESLPAQVSHWINELEIDSSRWQSERWLVNLPALNVSTALVLAQLHGRMGYFPACVRIVPKQTAVSPKFLVAEVLNLQAVRNTARRNR